MKLQCFRHFVNTKFQVTDMTPAKMKLQVVAAKRNGCPAAEEAVNMIGWMENELGLTLSCQEIEDM